MSYHLANSVKGGNHSDSWFPQLEAGKGILGLLGSRFLCVIFTNRNIIRALLGSAKTKEGPSVASHAGEILNKFRRRLDCAKKESIQGTEWGKSVHP